MKIDRTKSPKQKLSERVAHSTIRQAYVTIIGTILGVVLTWSQVSIAISEESRARRTEPLAYTLEAVDTHYQYEVQSDDDTVSFPAPSLRLRVTHGSLHSIAAISFNGNEFYQLTSLPMQEQWNRCTVDITLPAQSVIVDGDTIYDYFFLFLEPTEGKGQLDLICNTIDLNTQQVQTGVLSSISLAQLDSLGEGPQKEMLSAYYTLHKKLAQLALLDWPL